MSINHQGSHGDYAHRPMAWGTHGMVGAGTQFTAQAGMRALWQGGNAVDAAVASALAGGVVEPTAHYTLGGEIAFLFYDASENKVRSVVGQGWAPAAATAALYREKWGEIPAGALSTTVPGVVSALLAMLSRYGTMSFGEAVGSALSLAGDGFPAYQYFCRAIASPQRMPNIRNYPDTARVFLPGGAPPEEGALFRQPDLATTLSLMASAEGDALGRGGSRDDGIEAARDVFYRGEVAGRMVEALSDLGSLHTREDFAEYESPFEEPISTTYRGYRIHTNRTWTQGIVLLQALDILEGYDLASMGHNSEGAVHLMVEALKLAFADREGHAGDPDFVDVPIDGLLSKEYAVLRRGLLDATQAQAQYPPGDPRRMRAVQSDGQAGARAPLPAAASDGDEVDGTTYLSTADSSGNMVSATPSTFGGLTQGMMLGDTGIVINCRGSYFWLETDNPNAIAPRKRPRTTPCTFIVTRGDQPFMTLGTPGGDSQPQSCLQVLCNIVDFGMNVQEAVAAPRFRSSSFPASPWPHAMHPNRLALEARAGDGLASGLRRLGHEVEVVGPWAIRNGFTPIVADPAGGVFRGGADPRGEAVMLGW